MLSILHSSCNQTGNKNSKKVIEKKKTAVEVEKNHRLTTVCSVEVN